MKVESTNGKEFSPFTLNITIESKRELEMLWCFFNTSTSDCADICNKGIQGERIKEFKLKEVEFDGHIWSALDKKLKTYTK